MALSVKARLDIMEQKRSSATGPELTLVLTYTTEEQRIRAEQSVAEHNRYYDDGSSKIRYESKEFKSR